MITEIKIFRAGETDPSLNIVKSNEKLPLAFSDSEDFPKWAKLSNQQCKNCSLDATHYWCPAAVSIASCIKAAATWDSTEPVMLVIIADARQTIETLSATEALSSVLINQIIHSTCPLMQFDFWFWKFFSASLTIENVLFRRLAIDLICREFSKQQQIEFSDSRTSAKEMGEILTYLMRRIHHPDIIAGDALPNAFTKLSALETYSTHFQDEIYEHILQGLNKHQEEKI